MLISIFAILSALYIEHILSISACKLCLYQRIPYIISIIICFFAYFFPNIKIWIYLMILTFLSSLAVSGYHLGIENDVFKEFSGCTNQNLNTIDKSELLESLKNFLPNCKNVNFRLLLHRLFSEIWINHRLIPDKLLYRVIQLSPPPLQQNWKML